MIALVITAQAAAQQAEARATEPATVSPQATISPATALATGAQPNTQAGAPSPLTHTIKVPRRAGLKFVMVAPLSSETSKVGDDVPLRLAQSLVINNVTVLPAGEIVHGRVVKVKKTRACKDGTVKWNLDSIPFPDGSTASTRIWQVGMSVVPDRLLAEGSSPEEPLWYPAINNWWDVILGLPMFAVDAALIAIFLGLAIIAAPAFIGQGSCTRGKDYKVRAETPVAIMVTKTHLVRY